MKTFFLFLLMINGVYQIQAQGILASAHTANKPETLQAETAKHTYHWEFYSALRNYADGNYSKADEQLFGKDLACLLSLLDETFVRKEQLAAGDPVVRTHIIKPVVYNTVKNIAKYYKQKNRMNNYTIADRESFSHVVKVAIACVEDDTADFEQALKKSKKDAGQQILCFQQVKLRNIYE